MTKWETKCVRHTRPGYYPHSRFAIRAITKALLCFFVRQPPPSPPPRTAPIFNLASFKKHVCTINTREHKPAGIFYCGIFSKLKLKLQN